MRRPLPRRFFAAVYQTALALTLVFAWPAARAHAEVDLQWSGRLQTDLRLRVDEKRIGDWAAPLELQSGVSRNENIARLRLEAEAGRFFGVAEVDFVWIGIQRDLADLGALYEREQIAPYRLEAHALYAEATGLWLSGLDLRVGMQKVAWGKGDQFNPTNNLNANDLEDQLLFGEQIANAMVRLDYNPKGNWTLSAVLVPVFMPAQLPRSGDLALAATDRMPFVEDQLRWRLHAERALARELGYPTVVTRARPVLPETRLDNMQASVRVAGTLAEQDVALSYYVGRSDMPQPWINYSVLRDQPRCRPGDATECVSGQIETEVSLFYPRMQVVGLNVAGQLNLLGWASPKIRPLGYRLEAALVFPQESTLALLQQEILGRRAGEYDYALPGGQSRPLTVTDRPFPKWVLGLDYTFNRYLYVNVQWVHGLSDEFGSGAVWDDEGWAVRAGTVDDSKPLLLCATVDERRGEQCAVEVLRPRIGDYLVVGTDLKLLDDKLLARLFLIFDLIGVYEERWDAQTKARVRTHKGLFSADGFSAVIFPELTYNLGRGFELSGGALVKLGKTHTKFGDPAAGGSEVWTRARFSF